VIIIGGTTGVLGAIGGCSHKGSVPGPVPLKYSYELRISGGYGWLFQSGANPTKMLLIVDDKSKVTVDPSSVPFTDGGLGQQVFWTLDGATTFTQGMGTSGIIKAPASNPSDIKDPFGPSNPEDDDSWNDLEWVAGKESPKANALSLASRYVNLTEGTLTVHRPQNDRARKGRWVFTDANGTQRKRALSDRLSLAWSSNSGISIRTCAGSIVFTPKTNKLVMSIRHELDPDPVPIDQGDALPHFRMLYDFVNGKNCAGATAPTYDQRTDVSGSPTPGDFCPPLWLEP
jgi:hypothetical protein